MYGRVTIAGVLLLLLLLDFSASAADGDSAEPRRREHWAFVAPERPEVPASIHSHPIDALLDVERQRRGLRTVPEEEPRLLLRRLYLDLIGLPPTVAELEAFANDTRPDAWERVVDRLLANPHHGERWGRHWMDVWRYTDWYGLGAQLRYSQKHIWRWRDWIIESLNTDKGYDRMVLEMLAADELFPTDADALRGTGFLARNYYLFNRTTWLDQTIEHTSKALLGLTMNCAKCHDHKYDPITQLDYYRMRAIFEPHQVRLDTVPGEMNLEKDGLPRVFDAHPDTPTHLHVRGDANQPDKSRTIAPGVPEFFALRPLDIQPVELPLAAFWPASRTFVLEDHLRAANDAIATAREKLRLGQKRLEDARAAGTAGDGAPPASAGAKPPPNVAHALLGVEAAQKSLVAAELRPVALRTAMAADLARRREPAPDNLDALINAAAAASRQLKLARAEAAAAEAEERVATSSGKARSAAAKKRAAAKKELDKVRAAAKKPAREYASLTASLKALEGPDENEKSRRQPYPRRSTGRRSAFAHWVVDPENPLTARVAVNHIWMRHFGRPLVEPVTDLGQRTARPPHRALLDWLAVELVESGWRQKRLHRLIVTSRAYRLSSSSAARVAGGVDVGLDFAADRRLDPENRFYWRGHWKRMESQAIRDSLLALAGVLDHRLGGPTVDPGKGATHRRRSLYFTHSRDHQHRFLGMFDDASIFACYRRSESVVPQQALTLVNSALSLRLARQIAREIEMGLRATGKAGTDRDFAEAAFATVLSRWPTEAETAECVRALRELEAAVQRSRARQDLVHALINHNDFITIR